MYIEVTVGVVDSGIDTCVACNTFSEILLVGDSGRNIDCVADFGEGVKTFSLDQRTGSDISKSFVVPQCRRLQFGHTFISVGPSGGSKSVPLDNGGWECLKPLSLVTSIQQ